MAMILLTNDDGYKAMGLKVLYEHLAKKHDVWIAAPKHNQSGSSHSVTLHKKIRVEKFSENCYWIDGTPADCIMIGIHVLLPRKPDVVISGINQGFNVAEDVIYSGTVAGAREAALMGIPSLAVSMGDIKNKREVNALKFEVALPFVDRILDIAFKIDRPLLYNLNVPNPKDGEIPELLPVRLGNIRYHEPVQMVSENEFLIAGVVNWSNWENTDVWALSNGFATVTPLEIDLTDKNGLERIRQLL